MPYLEISYQNKARGLRAIARVAAAWCRHKMCYCFSEQDYLDFRADWRIRVQVQVIGSPYFLNKDVKQFPEDLVAEGDSQSFHYVISGGNLELSSPDFVKHLQWFENSKKAGVFSVATIWTESTLNFDVKLWIMFHPPPNAKPKTVWEWDTIGPSAGLPNLGKRR
jgi:hypothetical protein